jgi:hypothetical protein
MAAVAVFKESPDLDVVSFSVARSLPDFTYFPFCDFFRNIHQVLAAALR